MHHGGAPHNCTGHHDDAPRHTIITALHIAASRTQLCGAHAHTLTLCRARRRTTHVWRLAHICAAPGQLAPHITSRGGWPPRVAPVRPPRGAPASAGARTPTGGSQTRGSRPRPCPRRCNSHKLTPALCTPALPGSGAAECRPACTRVPFAIPRLEPIAKPCVAQCLLLRAMSQHVRARIGAARLALADAANTPQHRHLSQMQMDALLEAIGTSSMSNDERASFPTCCCLFLGSTGTFPPYWLP